LQKKDAKEKDNVCPQFVGDQQEAGKQLQLDLDYQCSLKGLQEEFGDYYKGLMNRFDRQCLGEESCDLYVRNRDWPEPCGEKIGLRL
jgi:hypothetical protein